MRGEDTDDTRSCRLLGTQHCVESCRIGRSSLEGINTGLHVKAPVRSPFSSLSVFHAAPRSCDMAGDNSVLF